jgi:hypothetical protein
MVSIALCISMLAQPAGTGAPPSRAGDPRVRTLALLAIRDKSVALALDTHAAVVQSPDPTRQLFHLVEVRPPRENKTGNPLDGARPMWTAPDLLTQSLPGDGAPAYLGAICTNPRADRLYVVLYKRVGELILLQIHGLKIGLDKQRILGVAPAETCTVREDRLPPDHPGFDRLDVTAGDKGIQIEARCSARPDESATFVFDFQTKRWARDPLKHAD